MKNQNTDGNINYRRMIRTDAWELIFNSITRLITIEEDLGGENVQSLYDLKDLAERTLEKTSGKHDPKKA